MNHSIKEYEIISSPVTHVEHRGDCKVTYDNDKYPIFASPMTCVIDRNNYDTFEKMGIQPILPRSASVDFEQKCRELEEGKWVAFGLDDVQSLVTFMYGSNKPYKICIDIALGNMSRLFNSVDKLKTANPSCIIMSGNVSNENTYFEYAIHGIDYLRASVGSGSVCTTSAGSGCHHAGGTLIKNLANYKQLVIDDIESHKDDTENPTLYKCVPKIVADGGFTTFAEINIALALGADYVMLGNIIARSEEACGPIDPETGRRIYYGMSTQIAQREFGKTDLRTAQGIKKTVPIEYSFEEWLNKFAFWLREAMSETDCLTLEDFIGNVRVELHSMAEFESYNKPLMDV